MGGCEGGKCLNKTLLLHRLAIGQSVYGSRGTLRLLRAPGAFSFLVPSFTYKNIFVFRSNSAFSFLLILKEISTFSWDPKSLMSLKYYAYAA